VYGDKVFILKYLIIPSMVERGEEKKGGRTGFIKISVFWGLVFSFGVFALGTVYAQSAEDYVGAEECKSCHDEIYNSWSKTGHFNERGCVECHTTGGRPDGSYILKKVQCEMCHTPGADHVSSKDKKDIAINWSANLCGQCHRTSHFPQFEEWEQSAHAESLLAADGLVGNDSKCQGCHVSQAVITRFEGETRVVDTPEPVDCQTCHDPHGSSNERQLRFPAEELCIQCHNTKGAEIGGAASHPQAEMLSDSIMHKADITCYDCHKYIKVYKSEISPRITGHTFDPRSEQCITTNCHPDKDVKWARNTIRIDQYTTQKLLEEAEHELSILDSVLLAVYPSWDGSKKSIPDAPDATLEVMDKYLHAKHNIEFVTEDGSFGVHNRIKAESMLTEVKPLVEESLEILRTEVRGAREVIPEEPAAGVCGPAAVLLLAMVPVIITRLRK
jgi:predicted CXXCH cytochrome family protein